MGESLNNLSSHLLSNPLESRHTSTPAPLQTQTIGSRTVFHEAQAALRPLLATIQTQEQLDTLVDRLETIRFATTHCFPLSFEI